MDENIRNGALLVLKSFTTFTHPGVMGGPAWAELENIMVIVEGDPDEDGSFMFKTDWGLDAPPVWIPSLESEDNIIVLAQDADSTKSVRDELLRLLPEVIANLAAGGLLGLDAVAELAST